MSKKPKPKKVPFESVEIDTWAPTRPGQFWIAMFRGYPIIFKGTDQSQSVAKARQWREDEMAKEARKKENAKAAGERLKAWREKA